MASRPPKSTHADEPEDRTREMDPWMPTLDERHRWWDDSPHVTLFHGTSSAILDDIAENGLRPHEDLEAYALGILEDYIPREQWTDSLLDDVRAHAIRSELGRKGENGSVLFLCTSPDRVHGYAASAAHNGGEIARNVWESACLHVAPGLSWRDLRENPPLKPRFATARPLVLAIEVPKAWCLWRQDPVQLKEQLVSLWVAKSADAREHETLAGFLDEALDGGVEVRIARVVPPDMIRIVAPAPDLSSSPAPAP